MLAPADRRRLGRRAQLLAATSVGYNLLESAVAVTAGAAAGSAALVGFGLDSLVEVGSGLVILWQFRHTLPETRERAAMRLIAVSFFLLAGYVTFDSARSLLGVDDPAPSPVGIALAVLSLLIMPILSWAQRRAGRALGSGSVVADSKQTLLCTYLSAVLLAGLLLNSLLGWGWADPLAGLVIAGVAAREGVQAWRGEDCCPPPVRVDTVAEPERAETSCHDRCHQLHEVGTHRVELVVGPRPVHRRLLSHSQPVRRAGHTVGVPAAL